MLFTTLCNVKPDGLLWVPLSDRPQIEQAHTNCSLRTGAGCHFRQVALRGPPKCAEHTRRLGSAYRTQLAVPVHVSSEGLVRDIGSLVRLAAGSSDLEHTALHRVEPSTGFHAVVTMALRCDALTAIGFDGDGETYDGHTVTREHTLAVEHMLLRLLQRGTVAGLPHGWSKAKLRVHYVKAAGKDSKARRRA